LNRCNQLLEPDTQEEEDERAQVRLACIKAFLLLLLGWTIFPARTAKTLICCGCLRCKIWTSWTAGHGVGWDSLSHMSNYLLPPTHLWPPVVVTLTLLVIIFVFLLFYLLDRKCIVVCIIFVLI